MPFCFAEFVEEVDALFAGQVFWKKEFAGIKMFPEKDEELASELGRENTAGKQEVVFCGDPVPVG
jgi:hypothetical protein